MKFSEYPFNPPNLKKIQKEGSAIIATIKNAKTSEEASTAIEKWNKLIEELSTDITVISVRFSINSKDEKYKEAVDLIDEISPYFSQLNNDFNMALLSSPHRKELEKKYGKYLFDMMENEIKTFSPAIIEDLQLENKLTTEYNELVSSGEVVFRGETYTLTQMGRFMNDLDRETRKEASTVYWAWYAEHQSELENFYDQLVKVRDKMAKTLGYENYLGLGYARMGRLDYGPEDVAIYREEIKKNVTPLYKKLRKRQAKRIKIDNPEYYDYNLSFLSGNAKPAGDREYLVNAAKAMYNQMDPEIGEFFTMMVENELLDLDAKPGKRGGGYMTYFPRYKTPFIFANFNGTQGDVETLTHEVGHAFQAYEARNIEVPAYQSPTLEACEIHSMSMEYFTKPFIDDLFKKDTDKFKFSHIEGTLTFLPYGVSVDEFQEWVYLHPTATPAERNATWRKIELKYTPGTDYGDNEFLNQGGRWMRQHHIFSSPLYYIDYTLAQVVAFQFALEMKEDYGRAWNKYVNLCRLGGQFPFVELLHQARLRNPFEKGNMKKVIKPLVKELKSYDDLAM